MPLSKKDNPEADKSSKADAALEEVIDAGAGSPYEEAAEDLPERDPVEEAHKEAATADDAGTEAKAKAKVVELSPDAAATPSGAALLKTADIKDDVKRAEAYRREKAAMRWGGGE